MKGWIEVTSLGSGRKTLVNLKNILWVCPAQAKGRDYAEIKTVNGSLFIEENYDFVVSDIEEAMR